MVQLTGSCHCESVTFSLRSSTSYPFMYCYCSICRVSNGGSGCGINIMGLYNTLRIHGENSMKVYSAKSNNGIASPNQRYFCGMCGSYLFAFSESYPQWVYPFAAAMNDLPTPPAYFHIMLDSKPKWVQLVIPGARVPSLHEVRAAGQDGLVVTDFEGKQHTLFSEYPSLSIEGFHKANGIFLANA